jgi:hypothetical protein
MKFICLGYIEPGKFEFILDFRKVFLRGFADWR